MSLIDETHPYELLIRYDEEGRPKAAHIQYRRIVRMGDEVLKNEPLPPQPLAIGGAEWDKLIGTSLSAALAQVNESVAAQERLAAELDAVRAEARESSAAAQSLLEQRDQGAKIIEHLAAELAAERVSLRQAERALRELQAATPAA